jgi:TRAP-type mannitol/chloroaromatic compound transport system permease small subunit
VNALDALLRAALPATRIIDFINRNIGKRTAWLILLAVVVSAVNAVVRKVLDTSSNAWLELQWVLFSFVFLMCAPWTLLDNEHVRIDIVNHMMPKPVRNAIEVIGHTFFLLPLCIILVITGIPFFLKSAAIDEQSWNTGGLPQWPTKSFVMIAFALLLVQGISELVKRIAVIRGLIPDPHAGQKSSLEMEANEMIEAMAKQEDATNEK